MRKKPTAKRPHNKGTSAGVAEASFRTEQEFEAARAAYRDRACGIFGLDGSGTPYVRALTDRLEAAVQEMKEGGYIPVRFDEAEFDQVVALLKCDAVLYAGQYTWRGKGGNKPGDDRFDAELAPMTSPETEMRARFVEALKDYAFRAATLAMQVDFNDARMTLQYVLAALSDDSYDLDEGYPADIAQRIAIDTVRATRLLKPAFDTWKMCEGTSLTPTDLERLFDKIEGLLRSIETGAETHLAGIRQEVRPAQKAALVVQAIEAVGVQLQDVFLPVALKYGEAEEAPQYDETRIGGCLLKLVREVFRKESKEYDRCDRLVEQVNEAIAHPVARTSEYLCVTKNEQGDTVVYVPPAFDDLLDLVRETRNKLEAEAVRESQEELIRRTATEAVRQMRAAQSGRGCRFHSAFAGETLGQTPGHTIKVDPLGNTFECLTDVGGGKTEWRSYFMKGKGQLEFLDTLLAAYKKDENGWVDPGCRASAWRPKYFKRGDAKQFLDDRHIKSEKSKDGGYTGRVKIKVP